MEHNNATTTANLRSANTTATTSTTPLTTTATTNNSSIRGSEQVSQKAQEPSQQQHQQQHQHQPQHHQHLPSHQQSGNDHQQQFCLRWHNHQTSLLSTLPILLDQSHLTDVTISAEGRTLRAHRVVLSACSSFFLEIFRTLDNTHHPVIIIPGASFQAIVSLLTFMYSGEVNVYEEQIPTLLSLAETLGIKGLADVHNNLQKNQQKQQQLEKDSEEPEKSVTPPTPPPPTAASIQTTSGNFTIPQAPTSVLPPAMTSPLNTSPFSPLLNPSLSAKFPSPLENFFLKSFQFYPSLMHQPLNFSQTALNKTSELLAKYQQQCNLYQANLALNTKDLLPLLHPDEGCPRSVLTDDLHASKRFCTGIEKKHGANTSPQQSAPTSAALQSQRDLKRIDKIVENLRGSSGASTASGHLKNMGASENNANSPLPTHLQNQLNPLSVKTSMENYVSTSTASSLTAAKSSMFSSPTSGQPASPLHSQLGFNISAEDQLKLQQHLDKYAASCAVAAAAAAGNVTDMESIKQEPRSGNDKILNTPQSPQSKAPSNSKLYATCFICHKQLSNQYNLRVHLETHQNVRYACNVCSHVSRSKDALRKHVSYRHPGAPSPCETEARRKRANKLLASSINATAAAAAAVAAANSSSSSGELTPTSPNNAAGLHTSFQSPSTERSCSSDSSHAPQLSAAQLNSAYQMFLPNQFHLAAAAANAAAAQQLFRENTSSPNINKNNNNTINNNSTATPSTPPTTPSNNYNAPGNMQNNSFIHVEGKNATITPDTVTTTTTPTTTATTATISPTHTIKELTTSNNFATHPEPKTSPSITNP